MPVTRKLETIDLLPSSRGYPFSIGSADSAHLPRYEDAISRVNNESLKSFTMILDLDVNVDNRELVLSYLEESYETCALKIR